MGLGTLTLQANAVRSRTVATAPRETGRLKAFSAVQQTNAGEPNQTWVRLSLSTGGSTIQDISIVLAQGYIGPGMGVTWTGDIPMDGGNILMVEAWSSAGALIRATSLTEKK